MDDMNALSDTEEVSYVLVCSQSHVLFRANDLQSAADVVRLRPQFHVSAIDVSILSSVTDYDVMHVIMYYNSAYLILNKLITSL